MKKALVAAVVFGYVACLSCVQSHCSGETGEKHTEDHGKKPWTVNIEEITTSNTHFRTTKWTGEKLQMTLMSIPTGGEIGGEKHSDTDQFIRIESGTARILMGDSEKDITFDTEVSDDWAIFIPAGSWHNLINNGEDDLKLYSIYAPAQHEAGTLHPTFEDSAAAHHDH